MRSYHSPVVVYDGCGIVAFIYWLRLKHGCANHAIEGETLQPPSTAGSNEASLLVQWRTMYIAIRLFVYTVCCRPGCQCFSVLRTRK